MEDFGFGFFGRMLILLGVLLALVGVLMTFAGRIPWLGRLPGDIFVQRRNFSFYFPITTSLLISVLLSLFFWFVGRR